ncbi:hypothetical protein LTR66_014414 [Elasticomyces elasticus]|nr:hypothetical protein LTR66_014414 [Elasticomyces elasticus]
MPCSFEDQTTDNVKPLNGNGVHLADRPPPMLAPAILFPTPVSNNAPTPTSLMESMASPRSPNVLPSSQQSFNHLDLELVHYYSTQTYMTMTSKLTAHHVWRDVVFNVALKHDFLLHAMMATAALHKATNHAENSAIHAEYTKVAFSYQNAALAGYIPALSRPDEDNAVALFILSALLTIWLFGSKNLSEVLSGVNLTSSPNFVPPQKPPASKEQPADFIEILTLLQGINAVFKQTIHWLTGSELAPLLTAPTEADLTSIPADIEASFQKLRSRIDSLQLLAPEKSQADRIRHDMYVERYEALRRVSRIRTVLEWDQFVFSWPVTSEAMYLELMRQRDPICIALFIHWAACFKCLDHLWWAKGWSKQFVKDASMYLDGSWSDVIAWPRREVGLD